MNAFIELTYFRSLFHRQIPFPSSQQWKKNQQFFDTSFEIFGIFSNFVWFHAILFIQALFFLDHTDEINNNERNRSQNQQKKYLHRTKEKTVTLFAVFVPSWITVHTLSRARNPPTWLEQLSRFRWVMEALTFTILHAIAISQCR